ncbi:hypothetical protein H2203_004012 [Taxawa tesnikishii (nom. ined.)]|nr:hypothetical protein H2203_004012 [Dothideales sp. JES 119]
MLSKALEKANTAVLLDNAMNYEGALDAYWDACRLLQLVMERTAGYEDKRKLDAIRDTYTARIDELHHLQAAQSADNGKELPPRPMSEVFEDSSPPIPASKFTPSDRDSTQLRTATVAHIVELPGTTYPTRDSFLTTAIKEVEGQSSDGFLGPLWEKSKTPFEGSSYLGHRNTQTGDEMDSAYVPRPLSPRPLTPVGQRETTVAPEETTDQGDFPAEAGEPGSWLDTIDESGSSCSSSVHSVSLKGGLHRKDIRAISGDTNPEFDAAFDAAVEAAYEDGLEPDGDFLTHTETLAGFATAETDFDAALDLDVALPPEGFHGLDGPQCEADTEAEEERMLDDITKDYINYGFDFDLHSKSALPRQSDSSGYSRSTWQSSMNSDHTTAGTSLSTVAEDKLNSQTPGRAPAHVPLASVTLRAEVPGAPGPPPNNALPRPPSLVSKRLSGPNFKQLKIETSAAPQTT